MDVKGINTERFKVNDVQAIYKDKREKLTHKPLVKPKSNDGFPQMLDEEIKKLAEKDNSNLKFRR